MFRAIQCRHCGSVIGSLTFEETVVTRGTVPLRFDANGVICVCGEEAMVISRGYGGKEYICPECHELVEVHDLEEYVYGEEEDYQEDTGFSQIEPEQNNTTWEVQ